MSAPLPVSAPGDPKLHWGSPSGSIPVSVISREMHPHKAAVALAGSQRSKMRRCHAASMQAKAFRTTHTGPSHSGFVTSSFKVRRAIYQVIRRGPRDPCICPDTEVVVMAGRADDPAGRSPAVPSRFPAKNQRGSSLVIGFPDRQNSAERSVPIESTIMCREKTCHMQRGRAGAARRGGRRLRGANYVRIGPSRVLTFRVMLTASVLYGLGAPQCANGLKCYTTPYKPCEVDRGYTGNCLEDIGVERECTVENATCKTVMPTDVFSWRYCSFDRR